MTTGTVKTLNNGAFYFQDQMPNSITNQHQSQCDCHSHAIKNIEQYDVNIARDRMINRNREAWKNTFSK